METLIIACKTLENELERVKTECACPYDVRWVESGLHNVPKNLTAALQAILDSSPEYSRALFALGFCGNSVSGLRSGEKTLIIPRVDDCISLLLGSYENKAALSKGNATYYMTKGWLLGERNIWREYQYAVEKYGEEIGKSIIEMMLEHIRTLALLDTGCFDLAGADAEVRVIAEALKLEYKIVPGVLVYIRRLLTGPWDDKLFLIVPPHSTIKDVDLVIEKQS